MLDNKQREQLLNMLLGELEGMAYLSHADESWSLEYASDGCQRLTGYPAANLMHNKRASLLQITHKDDKERVWDDINTAVTSGQAFSLVYRIIHADGSLKWVWERGCSLAQPELDHSLIHGFIQDITERHYHEKALVEAEQRYRSIFENAIEGIFQTSIDGSYIQVNQSLARMYGYRSPDEMMRSVRNIKQQLYCIPQRRDEFIQIIREFGIVKHFESEIYKADGSVIWISENAYEVHDSEGELLYYEGTVEDISERKRYEQFITHQATHDSLTNLPNRTLLMDRIDQAIHRAHRTQTKTAVVFIDLDHFKNVNDSYGHDFGDALLKTVAERLQLNLREVDTAARLGGDEFVVVLPDIHQSSDQVSCIIDRILAAIEEPCNIHSHDYLITCSIGISLYPEDGISATSLLKNSDAAMYRAKQIGRNNYQFFTPSLNNKVSERIFLEQKLRVAINDNQFVLYYQPKLDIASNSLVGSEALIRWHMPDQLQPISPADFIPLAESSGLIIPLGQWVMNEACRQLRVWIDAGHEVLPVSINLSTIQFQQATLVHHIIQALQTHRIPPNLLIVEVTESCLALDEDILLKNLNSLNRLGVAISIDDFGTGYSNMHRLKVLPLKSMKIDRSFILGVEHDHRDQAIYKAMVAMAQNLDLQVVAEGIETQGQYEFVKSIGCDQIQGFHYSKPLTAYDFEKALYEQSSLQLLCSNKQISFPRYHFVKAKKNNDGHH